MKKLYFILLINTVTSLILLNSCGSENSSPNPFVAKWQVTKEEGTSGNVNVGSFYDFKNDTTVTISLGLMASDCSYRTSNDTLFIHFPSNITVVHTFKMNGDKLILNNITTDQILTLEKQ